MRKFTTFTVTILLIATVVLLGLYSTGQIGGDVTHVENHLYESGEFIFKGQLINGQFDGEGSLDFSDDSNYRGNFTDGRFDGNGEYLHVDKSTGTSWIFDGEFQEGSATAGTFYMRNGKAKLFEQDNNSSRITDISWEFVGRLPNSSQPVNGVFTFSDGTVYDGGFLNGLADGEGELRDAGDNLIYSGSFVTGLFHGQGTYYSSEGWVYQGGFENGTFHGDGEYREGDTVIRGVWENGFQVMYYD